MKRQNVKIIMVEPYFDLKTPNSIAPRDRRAGGGAAAVGRRRRRRSSDYFKLFDYDVNLLVDAIKRHGAQVAHGRLEIMQFLAAPFVASLILTGIHAYLGVHVVERGVIFVDLSLAQIAALGATIALLLPITGGDPHAPVVYWVSLAFTFIGAAIFSMMRGQRARIPQEAIIGICYAVASAAAILAMSKATSESRAPEGHAGRQHPRRVVARGDQDGPPLRRDRRLPLHLPEEVPGDLDEPRQAPRPRAVNVRFWDFLFYASFGFVVTSSVAIAGVLLVFCYLIVPSVARCSTPTRIGKRLAIGWTMGTVVSALGIYLS